ncbi:MAG: PLP-dependent aminotransferase family protein [Caulobacteraceae bacterium]
MTWTPTLPAAGGTMHARLTEALAGDIASGALKAGDRLPPQRDLAHRLRVSIGTVTRAYSEAERRGLISGQVGRGSFVAERAPEDDAGPIDLARNLPPALPLMQARLADGLSRIGRQAASLLDYAPSGGRAEHREAMARFLKASAHLSVSPDDIILTAGAQQGTAVALAAICRPGEAILAEEATFSGLKTLAEHMNYRLIPIALDAEGMDPASLDRMADETGARAVYILPVQNPTARLMGAKRRADIVSVARKRRLVLVEDDIYAAYAPSSGLEPLALAAPERVAYVTSLSKSLIPGLRVGVVVPPKAEGAFQRTLDALRAMTFGAPVIPAALAADWVRSGAAEEIMHANVQAISARAALAVRVLGARIDPAALRTAPHLWLPMSELEAERVAGRAMRAGVSLTPPSAPYLEGVAVKGLRLCVGGPRDLAELERGLNLLRAAFGDGAAQARDVV